MKIVQLTQEQAYEIQENLEKYNAKHVTYRLDGCVQIGLESNDKMIAGLIAYLSVYKIIYVDTVFVDEKYRRKGYGTLLVEELERRAKQLGVNTIRVDSFNWQGTDFYKALGYEEVGHYVNKEDDFEESFFVKRI